MSVAVKAYRGELLDLEYHARIAVCDASGKLLYSFGDPGRMTFARSSVKPMQAIAVCESGALEKYGVTERELALMCASHMGEDFHVEAVRGLLKKAGLDESALLCGVSLALNPAARLRMQSQGLAADTVHCVCSGKHSGMLLTACAYGEDISYYNRPEHPVQKRILDILADVFEFPADQIVTAIDGCDVPVHAMPLYKLAHGYARFATPSLFPEKRARIIERITKAVTTYPEMVAGTDQLCTDLMAAFGDRLICKLGADGFYGVGLRGRGMGIAVKLEDGNIELLGPIVARILEELGVITAAEAQEKLGKHLNLNTYNHAGTLVGHKELCFELKKA